MRKAMRIIKEYYHFVRLTKVVTIEAKIDMKQLQHLRHKFAILERLVGHHYNYIATL